MCGYLQVAVIGQSIQCGTRRSNVALVGVAVSITLAYDWAVMPRMFVVLSRR